MGRYHNALLLGDASERLSVLEASGNLPLAYMCAKVHGLVEHADRIKIAIETNDGEEKMQTVLEQTSSIETLNDRNGGRLLQPPTPIFRENNWPTLAVQKSTLADLTAAEPEAEEVEESDESGGRDVKRPRPDGWCPQCHVLREECFKPGDWACAFCGQHNYSDKIACSNWRCNRDKEVAADEDAAEVAGLASVRAANPITGWCDSCGRWRLQCWKPNDWECPQCNNHNYARKQALRQQ